MHLIHSKVSLVRYHQKHVHGPPHLGNHCLEIAAMCPGAAPWVLVPPSSTVWVNSETVEWLSWQQEWMQMPSVPMAEERALISSTEQAVN